MGHMWWDATFGLNSVTPKLVSQCFPNFNKSQARAPPCFAPTQPRCHTNPAASPEHVLSTEASVSYPSGHLGSLESHKKLRNTTTKKKRWRVNLPHTFSWNIRDHVLLAFHFIPSSALGLSTSQTTGAMYPSRTAKAEKTKKLNLVVSAPFLGASSHF